MMCRSRIVLAAMLMAGIGGSAVAGMPALLPSDWTANNSASYANLETTSPVVGWQVQALSFFLACLFVGAFAVQWLWNHARRDFPVLPQISYRRSLSLVVVWGLLFVVVLTMISGARELMTPGAWRKQGWTYQLEKSAAMADTMPGGNRESRRGSLEQLRTALWQYAATHGGKFPARDQADPDARLWDIPGHPGLQFLTVPDRSAEEAGRLLVFEPPIDGDDRLVLLTNGLIGSMRTDEIRLAVERREHLVEANSPEGGQ
ncbi:MAG: hypothetical protein IAG10_10450 [Planctomycetaceae bacterium]|nr:hypothetical protein [Planctomycetaceae bacterium]